MSGTAVFFQTVKLLIRMLQRKLYRQKKFARVKLGLHSTERPYMSPIFDLLLVCVRQQAYPAWSNYLRGMHIHRVDHLWHGS